MRMIEPRMRERITLLRKEENKQLRIDSADELRASNLERIVYRNGS